MLYTMNKKNYKDFSVVEIGKLPARAYFIPFKTREKLDSNSKTASVSPSFIKTLYNDFSYVVYSLDGVLVANVARLPYKTAINFSSYAGKTVKLTAAAYDSNGALCAVKTYNLKVAAS